MYIYEYIFICVYICIYIYINVYIYIYLPVLSNNYPGADSRAMLYICNSTMAHRNTHCNTLQRTLQHSAPICPFCRTTIQLLILELCHDTFATQSQLDPHSITLHRTLQHSASVCPFC